MSKEKIADSKAVHPLVDLVIRHLVSNGTGYDLDAKAAAALPAALVRLKDEEFVVAIRDLLAYATFLGEELRSPNAARFLFALAFAAAPRLEALVEEKKVSTQEKLKSGSKRFDRFRAAAEKGVANVEQKSKVELSVNRLHLPSNFR